MRINGEWFECLDGDTRPTVRAEILRSNQTWLEFSMLVDTGADRTLLSADILNASGLPATPVVRPVGGLGGILESVSVRTQLRFRRDDGVQVSFRGDFSALTEPELMDMSILGRDILDRFAVIVDRPSNAVAILGGRHGYTIHPAS